MQLKCNKYTAEISDGIITGFFADDGTNLADSRGAFGTVCYTLVSDDIRTMPHDDFEPYRDRCAKYTETARSGDNSLKCFDRTAGIETEYSLDEHALSISSSTDNPSISEFGINLDLNFLGKRGTDYRNQLLPTSPYTSEDGRYMYYILTRPNGKFAAVTAKTECDGWRIKYSPFSFGHFILRLQFLASFDRAYRGSGKKAISLSIFCADTLGEIFELIHRSFGAPLVRNVLSGGFDGYAAVRVCGDFDFLEIKAPSGKVTRQSHDGRIELSEFGFYSVTPFLNGNAGLGSTVWNGGSFSALFDKSCDGIRKPYHPDDNLCEGGCFLWEMLLNMRLRDNKKFESTACEELEVIMAKRGTPIPRRTILPYPDSGFAAYHICKSTRIQEQFFGVSILLDAYRLYRDRELLEFAVSALGELVDNFMVGGMATNGTDYTTVCCPMIPLADMANLLKDEGDSRFLRFRRAADEMAAFLLRRGYDFPTEGTVSELSDTEREDGSISCTALALLYYCVHIEYKEEYALFARDILKLHRAWTIYTPDARMLGSSFRWWETIWEGDGEGPAICAGHAWTIWKSEALFYCGILFGDDEALLESWNGFITNFSKTMPDGTMYSCYEPDYIRGGGSPDVKAKLKQLRGEDHGIKYITAHGYPKHPDNSLSRYAWVRACATWFDFSAVLSIDGEKIEINTAEKTSKMYKDGKTQTVGL